MRRICVLLTLVLLAGCQHTQSDPKVQALAVLEAFHKMDWKAMAKVSAFPAGEKAGSNLDDFAAKFDKGFQATAGPLGHELFSGMTDLAAGEPTITSTKATVPVSGTFHVAGKEKKFQGVANMILEDGVWKWNLTEQGTFDAAIETQLKLLLGA